MDWILAVGVGVALAAATGFRVFVPLLVLALAARTGVLPVPLRGDWAWIASDGAVLAFSVATVLEAGAYYVPWLDHALDLFSAPAAVLAGTLLTVAVAGDLPPLLRWGTALLAGGGTAALVKGTTAVTRTLSTVTTGGLGNPVVATVETAGSAALSLVAVLVPAAVVLAGILLAVWLVRRRLRARPRGARPPVATTTAA